MTNLFRGLDSPSNSDVSSTSSGESSVDPIQVELLQLANAGKRSIETKLGINTSSRIVLDIVKMAQRAKSHRKECTAIANDAYLLLNAVVGGVKGRAIDVNVILRDHIARLNEDLEEIRQIIKGFASWWILLRTLSAPRGLEKCHDILHHGMDMYLLLLRCSLAQPIAARQAKKARRVTVVDPTSRPLPKTVRRGTYPAPRLAVQSPAAPSPWSQPPYRTRRPVGATA